MHELAHWKEHEEFKDYLYKCMRIGSANLQIYLFIYLFLFFFFFENKQDIEKGEIYE